MDITMQNESAINSLARFAVAARAKNDPLGGVA